MVSRFIVTDWRLPIKARGAMLLDSYYLILFFRLLFQLGPVSMSIGASGRQLFLFVPPFAIGHWLL